MAGAVEKRQRVMGNQCDIAPAPDLGAVERKRELTEAPALWTGDFRPSPAWAYDADLVRALRTRAGYAREEGTGTAIGDALHFEAAANAIERLLADRPQMGGAA